VMYGAWCMMYCAWCMMYCAWCVVRAVIRRIISRCTCASADAEGGGGVHVVVSEEGSNESEGGPIQLDCDLAIRTHHLQ
jgi:hypothetical protein